MKILQVREERTGSVAVGGIAGRSSGNIDNCTVNSSIVVTSQGSPDNYGNRAIGGICGDLQSGNITNCTNNAVVTNNNGGSGFGGIVGIARDAKHNIESCKNYGAVVSNGDKVGGICGVLAEGNNSSITTTITKCKNTAIIKGNTNVGGIAGRLGDHANAQVDQCYNTGNVQATGHTDGTNSNVAGIVGTLNTYNYIKYCYNKGSVTATYGGASRNIGGITGWMAANTTVKECYNTGKASSTYSTYTYVGGIVGYKSGGTLTWNYCYKTNNRYAIGGNSKTGTNQTGQAYYSTSGSECKSYWSSTYWNLTTTWPTLKNNP